ncbi:MAG: hypothetical protein JRH20_02200 [Deltaproteobacteria bacterium]|nr:hypothetical protein [Deltaproteobacteria bacterium]
MFHSPWYTGLGLALIIALSGCGGDEGVGDPVQDHTAYALQSAFDVQSDFGDSGLGSVLNMLKDMSDHPDDPGRYVIEQIVDALPVPISWAAEPFIGSLGKEINALIYEVAPTAADDAKALAEGLSQAARQFELHSNLEVGLDAEDRFTGKHALQSVTYRYQGRSLTVTAAELGDNAKATVRIPVQIEGDLLTIPEHRLQLPIGTLLDKTLDAVVVPSVVEDLSSFAAVIDRWFACTRVAAMVSGVIGAGDAEVLSACLKGSGSVSSKLHDKLLALDKDGALRLHGTATANANGSDYQGSGWSGRYIVGKDAAADLDPQRCPFSAQKQAASR